jgi:transposase
MQVVEILRRWQARESIRAIAQSTGLARNSVRRYLRAAAELGLSPHGPPATNDQLATLARLSDAAPAAHPAPRQADLEPYRERIAAWVDEEHLQLTRVAELLAREGVVVPHSTLRRFVQRAGLGASPKDTVRRAPSAPGELAEADFGRLGPLLDATDGSRRIIWALSVVLPYSRHSFVWLLGRQTLAAVIEGLEATWAFFGGVPRRLVIDNFPAAVAHADALTPVPTRGFLEYSQARGFLLDPARVRHPKDKPHTERSIQYIRERFWKGGTFADLADARDQARRWCLEVAGQRVHGTTRRVPLAVFQDEERAQLLAYDGVPYDVPTWATLTVHPDHHVAYQHALYSVPAATCPPGTQLEVRADAQLVKLYWKGKLIKTHQRQAQGGRSTDTADYPAERTTYALRSPDRVVREAMRLGPFVGLFAERLLSGDFPWAKLRQGQKLLRLAEPYAAARLDAACERALAVDLVDVRRLERILQLALEQEPLPGDPPPARLPELPSARFARDGAVFDHRTRSQPDSPEVPA